MLRICINASVFLLLGFDEKEKQGAEIHPKIHSKIQIRIWELRGQNPHCKDLASTRDRRRGHYERVFSLEESLESLRSPNSLESLENGRILLFFHSLWVL